MTDCVVLSISTSVVSRSVTGGSFVVTIPSIVLLTSVAIDGVEVIASVGSRSVPGGSFVVIIPSVVLLTSVATDGVVVLCFDVAASVVAVAQP